jgi:hypothetical protein
MPDPSVYVVVGLLLTYGILLDALWSLKITCLEWEQLLRLYRNSFFRHDKQQLRNQALLQSARRRCRRLLVALRDVKIVERRYRNRHQGRGA